MNKQLWKYYARPGSGCLVSWLLIYSHKIFVSTVFYFPQEYSLVIQISLVHLKIFV